MNLQTIAVFIMTCHFARGWGVVIILTHDHSYALKNYAYEFEKAKGISRKITNNRKQTILRQLISTANTW